MLEPIHEPERAAIDAALSGLAVPAPAPPQRSPDGSRDLMQLMDRFK